MRHADFAALPLSLRVQAIEQAIDGLFRRGTLLEVATNGQHTYVAVELSASGAARVESATWLVCPQNLGIVHTPTGRKLTGQAYLDSGHYGMTTDEARDDATRRALRA